MFNTPLFHEMLDTGRAGIRLLLLAVFFCPPPPPALKAQTPPPICKEIANCDQLDVVIVLKEGTVVSGPNCPTESNCADRFRQATYRVYLRYKVNAPAIGEPMPDLDFVADYSRLQVRVALEGPTLQNSHIARTKTRSCFSTSHAAAWPPPPPSAPLGGNYAILDFESDNEMAFDLNNTDIGSVPCGSPGVNQLHFQPTLPGGTPNRPSDKLCSFVELFDVVINAYPGETFYLTCANPSEFVGFTNRDMKCANLNCGVSQALPVTVPLSVASYSTTPNQDLRVNLTGSGINPVTRNCETDLTLSVSGMPTNAIVDAKWF